MFNRKRYIFILLAAVFLILLAFFFVYVVAKEALSRIPLQTPLEKIIPAKKPNPLARFGGITWGVDFSQSQAEYLELNWKEAYLALLDDLQVKRIKLHVNWSWIEGKRNDYYFQDVDWQIREAERKNAKVIYVLGMKTGRWPECHLPAWTAELSRGEQQVEVLEYIAKVVSRYRDSDTILYWQIENEPFLRFGECPWWYYQSSDFLEKEIRLVKSLDPKRNIVISDSGELSSWERPARLGDIVGITMYRNAWSPGISTFGINPYSFLWPNVYASKAAEVRQQFGKEVICIELQAEPWASLPLKEAPIEEQLRVMNVATFQENIAFAKKTGLGTFYFWGAEWWYWMKTKHGHPEIWESARTLFI